MYASITYTISIGQTVSDNTRLHRAVPVYNQMGNMYSILHSIVNSCIVPTVLTMYVSAWLISGNFCSCVALDSADTARLLNIKQKDQLALKFMKSIFRECPLRPPQPYTYTTPYCIIE